MSQWRRPTDDAYAFQLRAIEPAVPPLGEARDIRSVLREVLGEEDAARFEQRTSRWGGPEDTLPGGEQPYIAPQQMFRECPWQRHLSVEDLSDILRGTVRVMRSEGQTDYVLRDHHMLDVVLYHYRSAGHLPGSLFHADRHSDWCRDGYLSSCRPAQAATWWTLLEGLKRPDGAPVLGERQVSFTTAKPGPEVAVEGRDVGASTLVPWWVDRAALSWSSAIEQPGATASDWVSLDLDYFQPLEQLRLTRGLLRDARFRAMMSAALVRVFVLSPQFARGGDVLSCWTTQGGIHASLRMLNLVRGAGYLSCA